MKVVLLKEVKNLGQAGEIKEASDGYSRNYLIPNGFAQILSKHNIRLIEAQKQKQVRLKQEVKKNKAKLAKKINGQEFVIKIKCDNKGTLYAGLDSHTIAAELTKQGFGIFSEEVELSMPIKKLGSYGINLKLGMIRAMIKIMVQSDK